MMHGYTAFGVHQAELSPVKYSVVLSLQFPVLFSGFLVFSMLFSVCFFTSYFPPLQELPLFTIWILKTYLLSGYLKLQGRLFLFSFLYILMSPIISPHISSVMKCVCNKSQLIISDMTCSCVFIILIEIAYEEFASTVYKGLINYLSLFPLSEKVTLSRFLKESLFLRKR